jgi:non-specific serine/threonine protein kinase/serine/threonine-protein kinase
MEPPRPSTRITQLGPASAEAAANRHTEPHRLASDLRGDLDWVTMKALEKDRTRRYQTANALAADVRRHLNNEPVSAGPPSAVYRAKKFVRRHRFGVTAAATLVLLLVAFGATMAVQAQRIARERDRANREAATAKQVSEFLVGLFRVSDPNEAKGRTITAREILSAGAAKIDQSLRGQPEVQARLQTTIGDVFASLGLYRDAQPLLKQAADTCRRVFGNDHPATLEAISNLATGLWYEGKYSDAEALYKEVADRRERVMGERHRDTLKAYSDLASTYVAEGRLDEGERLLVKMLRLQSEVLGENAEDTLISLNNLQSVYYRQGRYAEAEPVAIKCLEMRRRTVGEDHPQTLRSIHNLATIYDKMGRYARAEELYLSSIEKKVRVLGWTHDLTARSQAALASMYQRQGRYQESERLALAAYETYVATLGVENIGTQNTAKQLAELYDALGKPEKAAEWRAKLSKPAATAPVK